ncbi:JAB domain-containing protein [Sphingopyxis macrogoltabida]|uniref:MPN domain-containing protein n=1 Tax=Sphingopyxis macrogoltabida TaxID=33050 RepID=A0AAC9FGW0_SPHMC|nr:JAB domain-containing protein [Sphingopyxis macrogoltabida]AMU91860.1 hypothetical protein ATM17_22875 [Sphingopyxis macrogoltabida]
MAQLLEPFAGNRAEAAAGQLIAHFGSLGRAIAAPREQLDLALGANSDLVHVITAARALVTGGLLEQISRTPVSVGDPAFGAYLRARIGKSPTECLHATFVTYDWRYLGDEILAEGTSRHVEANLRRLLSRAFDLAAHGVILAHNHPSGSAEPSAEDIMLTHRIASIVGSVGVKLLDHLVIGANEIASMRERGLL